MNLSKKEKILIMLLVVVMVGGGFYMYIYSPKDKELAANKEYFKTADKDLKDTKQDKSTAITTSNIANQTVNKAKYATDGVAVGTPALRNQYFASAESTPTVNGQICWVYG